MRDRGKKEAKISDWVKNSPSWKKLKKMDGDIAKVTKDF